LTGRGILLFQRSFLNYTLASTSKTGKTIRSPASAFAFSTGLGVFRDVNRTLASAYGTGNPFIKVNTGPLAEGTFYGGRFYGYLTGSGTNLAARHRG